MTTTPDTSSLEAPAMPTNADVNKVYQIFAYAVAFAQKNWKSISVVVTVLAALSTGISHYVSVNAETKTDVIALKQQLHQDEVIIHDQDTRIKTLEFMFTNQHKLDK